MNLFIYKTKLEMLEKCSVPYLRYSPPYRLGAEEKNAQKKNLSQLGQKL